MSVFPNSLELERRMVALGANRDQMTPSFERLEDFKKRFRDEKYMLMSSKQIDKDDLAETLAQATGTPLCAVSFLRLEECKEMKRDKQYGMYEQARKGSLRRYFATREFQAFAKQKGAGDRTMSDVVHGAIGTRRMTLALDNTFGNSFASLLKHDIVASWMTHLMAFIPKKAGKAADERAIAVTAKLVEYLTKVLPSIHLSEKPPQWITFVA